MIVATVYKILLSLIPEICSSTTIGSEKKKTGVRLILASQLVVSCHYSSLCSAIVQVL